MSYPVKYSILTAEDREYIARELTVVPAKPPIRRGKQPPREVAANAPFPMWIALPNEDVLSVPLAFAQDVFVDDRVPGESSKWRKLQATHDLRTKLRPVQTPVYDNALDLLRKDHTITLDLPTGFGKTIIATALSSALGMKTAVFVPRGALGRQWANAIESFGGLRAYELPEGSRITKSSVANASNADVLICLGTRSLSPVFSEIVASVGTLIVDEAHLACVPTFVPAMLVFAPKYAIALSATLEREDGAHRAIELMVGKKDRTVSMPPQRDYIVYVARNDTKVRMVTNPKTGSLDYAAYESALADSDSYNTTICDVVTSNPNRKFILLFRLTRHAEYICAALNAAGVNSELMLGDRRNYKDCRALCGTFAKISVGFDAANSATDFDGIDPDTVVFCNTTKQWQLYIQSAGRAMRAPPGVTPAIVWLLPDTPIAKKHLKGIDDFIAATRGVVVDCYKTPVLSSTALAKDAPRQTRHDRECFDGEQPAASVSRVAQ